MHQQPSPPCSGPALTALARFCPDIRGAAWGLLLLLIISSDGFGAGPPSRVDISEAAELTNLNDEMRYLIDPSNDLTLDKVLRIPASQWQDNPDNKNSFGQSDAAHWFHVRLGGLDQLRQNHYFQLAYPHHDKLDIYLVRDNEVLREYHTGDMRPFDTRPIPHRYFVVPLQWVDEARLDIYLRVHTGGPIQVPLQVLSQEGLSEQDNRDHLRFGAYFGIMALMFLYNGVIFLFVRDISYLFYILYIAATAGLQFTLNGLGMQYLWPGTTINNPMILMFTALMPATALVFVWRFVDLGRIGARWEKAIFLALGAGYAVVLLGIIGLPYLTTLKVAHALSFASVTLGFYLGIKYWLRGIKSARIFAFAWFSYLVFILIYLMGMQSIIQPSFFTQHALEIGSVIELVLLSLAFADRINEEKDLRLQTQLQMNQDLDHLVQERTEELEDANRKLKQLSITDGLTGAYNRRFFDDTYDTEYRRAYREKSSLAVIILDIDHFKTVNDTHGHQLGDRALQAVTSIIREQLKRPTDILARYGGEEFVILLPGTNTGGAVTLAETIRDRLASTPISGGKSSVTLTASFGICAAVPTSLEDPEWMLRKADKRLYRAKHGGRNRVEA